MCLGQIPPTASPSHQWQPAASDPRSGVFNMCEKCDAAETMAMKVDTLNRLRRNDRAMICWICIVKAKDEVSSDSLLSKLGIQDLDVVHLTSRIRWFGHIGRSTGWIAEVCKLNVVARRDMVSQRKHGMKCWACWLMTDQRTNGPVNAHLTISQV